ncbi:CDP-6-deoxy-delta-3,4-glucoseen reductase [Cupriavidus sp. JZ107]
MAFSVTVAGSSECFGVEPDETVLAAALRQGVALKHGCRVGSCGDCMALVVSGDIVRGAREAQTLAPAQRALGGALLCLARARSDLRIQAELTAPDNAGAEVRRMPCRVAEIRNMAPDVAALRLKLPALPPLRYRPGQYVDLILREGLRRSYSLATALPEDGCIEVHVRRIAGGAFSARALDTLRVGDILRLEGPFGQFYLREESRRPIVLLASGTGFAPIKAIVEAARAKGLVRPMTLYWGGRRCDDLYLAALARQWETDLPWFRFVPVLSESMEGDGWQGRTGLVHRAVMEDLPALCDHEVYACGAPAMVDAARRDFVAARGLPGERFFADAFLPAAAAP